MNSKTCPLPPPLFFDSRTGNYWFRLPDKFIPLDTASARLQLRHCGLQSGKREDGGLNDCERAFVAAQIERNVDYAGPLAGHRLGLFSTASGQRFLVTSEPKLTAAKKGSVKHLDKFFGELFGEQTEHVLHWLKCAREALLAGDFRPGQMLVLAGPSNCGKSLFQALVTEWLGGRSGKPYRYFVGETAFNADLASAEHWCIEDENASTDIRTRRNFGGRIKEATVNRELSIHAKGRQAVTLPTFRRLTLSVNDEPENLMILPPMDASLLDKVSLVRCKAASLSESRLENWKRLAGELPALAAMLDGLKIPAEKRCTRFGVKAWHHPELMDALSDLSPEHRLLNLIDAVVTEWPESGTAMELEAMVRNSKFGFAVDRLLYFPGAMGTYLGRLLRSGRLTKSSHKGGTLWTIDAPKS